MEERPVKVEVAGIAPVARVPYWTYLIPVIIAFFSLVQVLGLAWIGTKVDATTEQQAKTTSAVVTMEKQINSNMERQIRQAISEALAQERLRVE